MANLTVELNINSANNLPNVNLITKMNVYVVIAIHGDDTQEKQRVKTFVNRSGGCNPIWNHAIKFCVNERLAREGRLTFVMRLISRRVLGNKEIGRVNVPLIELLNSISPSTNGDDNGQQMKLMMYQVRTLSGRPAGTLNFLYQFKPDIPVTVNHHVGMPDLPSMAYPPSLQIEDSPSAPLESSIKNPQPSQPSCQKDFYHQKHHVTASSSYDPLPISYGDVITEHPFFYSSPSKKSGHAYHHALPPMQSSSAYYGPYGYMAPSPARYGYGSPSYQPPKEIGFGLGLEDVLLGGLMIGDFVSDVANCFDL